jgi:hypothetical protein
MMVVHFALLYFLSANNAQVLVVVANPEPIVVFAILGSQSTDGPTHPS